MTVYYYNIMQELSPKLRENHFTTVDYKYNLPLFFYYWLAGKEQKVYMVLYLKPEQK
jgi:hypothetical protein